MLEVLEHVVAGDGRERVERDLAGDGEQLGGVVVGVVEAPEALGDEILERGGRLERADEAPHAVVLGQGAGVACGLDELAQHARGCPWPRRGAERSDSATSGPPSTRCRSVSMLSSGSGSTVEAAEVAVLDEVVERRRARRSCAW